MSIQDARDEPTGWRKAASTAGLALLGAVFGAGLMIYTEDRFPTWGDHANFFLGCTLIAMAVVSGALMLMRSGTVARACGGLQIAVLLLAGAMLLLPVTAPETWPATWVFGAVVGLLLVQSGLNLLLWRRSDELLRQVTAETSALAFWVLQIALLLYAVAERLDLVETVSAWGLLAVLMAVYLLSSVVAAFRRGLT